ncbi:uncharacterized protein SCHCODRAFT_01305395 [Schizophyllum commune H4-8]|uniref:uncharacterized protein n=1 Tax=Schizophyllum commune (strain H4-8 / FGSC 9210) TaxID=578458 RepID=UPI0021609706|nr:uncharacterized protein SCHCODRAFT_01305395 [Schizophyllum commune H4-8]KAI5892894.1 hypothetical protein SCHCODRAFT_01305395 [Schizophyllum commune H4-8]
MILCLLFSIYSGSLELALCFESCYLSFDRTIRVFVLTHCSSVFVPTVYAWRVYMEDFSVPLAIGHEDTDSCIWVSTTLCEYF